MPDCINLRQVYGKRFRVIREEGSLSWEDPWYHMINCKFGTIGPNGLDELMFCSLRRGGVARRVAALPGAKVHQDGDDGQNITFPLAVIEQVFEIVHPYQRRHLSPERQKAGADRLRLYKERLLQMMESDTRTRLDVPA